MDTEQPVQADPPQRQADEPAGPLIAGAVASVLGVIIGPAVGFYGWQLVGLLALGALGVGVAVLVVADAATSLSANRIVYRVASAGCVILAIAVGALRYAATHGVAWATPELRQAVLLWMVGLFVVCLVFAWIIQLRMEKKAHERGGMFRYELPIRMGEQAYRPGDLPEAKEKFNSFLEKYFERVEPDEQDGAWVTSLWPEAFQLNWKGTALPNAEWRVQFLKPENGHLRRIIFLVTEDGVTFLSGIVFPIPLKEPASYSFLKQFSSDAPFKMIPQYFSVIIPIGKKGKYATRKPDAEISARLNEVIS